MSYYRNHYAGEEQSFQSQGQGRYQPVYPYGEIPVTPPVTYRHSADFPEQQRLLRPNGMPSDEYLHSHSPSTYHRGETLPMQHLDSMGRRTHPRRKVGELDLQGPGYTNDQREILLRSTPSTLRREPMPVKLAPGWESRNAPVDELNFRNISRGVVGGGGEAPTPTMSVAIANKGLPTFDEEQEPFKPPTDRCNVVYIILLLHGVGTLMPWNMFINANSYFVEFKLSPNNTLADESTLEHRENFLSYLGVSSQLPNVLCNALNLFISSGGGSLTCRIVTSILVEVIIIIITVVLAMLDSTTWAGTFFYVTMACVVVLNMACGVYQNSIYGTAAKLPMRYTNAIVIGSNLSGTLTSVMAIISIFASPSLRTAAIYYFLAALFILLVCFDTYFALPLSRYYRHYQRLALKAAAATSIGTSNKPPYWKIFKKTWPQCFNVFFIFFVTLSIFPAVQANVRAVDQDFIISTKYFEHFACYLNFNFFALIGNILSNWIKIPGPRFLWLPVLLRALLIPFFMLCNYKPEERVLPVLINDDWAFIGGGAFLGLTSGYFSSLAMMYAPKCVQPQHAAQAGMMAALFLVLGLFAGVNFSLFISWLVKTRLF